MKYKLKVREWGEGWVTYSTHKTRPLAVKARDKLKEKYPKEEFRIVPANG